MASLNSDRLRELEREVKEKRTLSVKLHCPHCQEIVPERLRLEPRWYSFLALLLALYTLGIYALPAAVAGAPFVCIHVHRCSKCDRELMRGSYLAILRKRRKLDTLGLAFPFYVGPALFVVSLIVSDFLNDPTWNYYQSVCGRVAIARDPGMAEREFFRHFYGQSVQWGGWYLGETEVPDLPQPCASMMMNYRNDTSDRADLFLCNNHTLPQWSIGSYLNFVAVIEKMKGPVLSAERVEVVTTEPFLRDPDARNQTESEQIAAGFLVGTQ